MFRISVSDHFDAAHRLREYKGKCANIHGHRFTVTVVIQGQDLDDQGLLIDFIEVKKSLGGALADLDHIFLNEFPPFDRENPTSENIARFIFQRMREPVERKGALLRSVTVAESPSAAVTYEP